MFKSFIAKFTFFFWLIFLTINIIIYTFISSYVKEILISAEAERISSMVDTLKPTIALDISFKQQKELEKVLNSILLDNEVVTVKLIYAKNKKILTKEQQHQIHKTFNFRDTIIDPFSKEKIATLHIVYTNKHLYNLNSRIFEVIALIFLFSLFIFSLFFIFVSRNLNALRDIADTLQKYAKSKKTTHIKLENRSEEMVIIANVANKMMDDISQHLHELESFNIRLQEEVEIKIKEQQHQEKLMIHQSRQAAMGEMLESIAHQWRQPLNIIGLATVNLTMQHELKIDDDKEFEEKMEIISDNINFMSDTIDDFRDFLNPQRTMSDFSVNIALQDVLKILKAQLTNNNIACETQTIQEINFYGVSNEFKQVLLVLINNAKDAIKTKFKDKNIKNGKLIFKIFEKNNKKYFEVCDNGGGIPTDIIDKIFEPYFTTKFQSQGTGIGLYMAKNIIQTRMKGSLSVKNSENGSCFRICFNINKPDYKEETSK